MMDICYHTNVTGLTECLFGHTSPYKLPLVILLFIVLFVAYIIIPAILVGREKE